MSTLPVGTPFHVMVLPIVREFPDLEIGIRDCGLAVSLLALHRKLSGYQIDAHTGRNQARCSSIDSSHILDGDCLASR